jgi:hypothetical protein
VDVSFLYFYYLSGLCVVGSGALLAAERKKGVFALSGLSQHLGHNQNSFPPIFNLRKKKIIKKKRKEKQILGKMLLLMLTRPLRKSRLLFFSRNT